MNIENKSFKFDIKATNDNDMTIEGYGSVFENLDSHRDIVQKGAFNRTIKNNRSRIKFLWQHDMWSPIGRPKEIHEDDKGLYINIKLSETQKGKECYILMKDKVINEMSIGYNTVKYEYDKEKDIRYIKEVKLYEISAVTWASNDKCRVSNVKNLDMNLIMNELKQGNLFNIENTPKEKILDVIKSLQALINIEDSDSSKDTQKIINDPPKIKNDIQYSATFNGTNIKSFSEKLLERLKEEKII